MVSTHRARLDVALACGAAALFALGLLRHLEFPLLWADEAETAMFARHTLEYGYPKVHGPQNVVYQFGPNIAVGVEEGSDAYIGTTWGHIYFAVPGLVWARGSDDLYAKTWRMRLPFALAGALGVGLWLAALLPAGPGRARRWRFAAAFLALAALSVSLVLHLREVRYYALVVLLGGAIAREHLGYVAYGTVGFRRWACALCVLLVLLFNTFFQAFFTFAALLGAERAVAVWRGAARPRDLLPFAAAGLLVAPLLAWFETFQTARAFSASFSFGPGDYLGNVALVGAHLLRHEFLLPAVAARAAVVALRVEEGPPPSVPARLLAFAAGAVAIGCLNPLPLERYFVVLSPVLSGAFLLDAFALARALPARVAPAQRRRVGALTLAALVLGTAFLRWPAFEVLRGRVAELSTPYRGPLDYVIPYLRERYAHPEDLVIATNYEEYAFMYYLRCRVIVGLSLNNIVRDRRLEPDVVVPRGRWPQSLAALRPFLARGEWETRSFPVRDLHHNNVPGLSRSRYLPDPHRFRTAVARDPDEQLTIYLRAPGDRLGSAPSG
jgi:hypothetical protein